MRSVHLPHQKIQKRRKTEFLVQFEQRLCSCHSAVHLSLHEAHAIFCSEEICSVQRKMYAPSEFFDDEARVQVVPMGVENAEERKEAGWRNEDEDAVATEGLISSADYSGVAMHGHSSPPAHKKHPKP